MPRIQCVVYVLMHLCACMHLLATLLSTVYVGSRPKCHPKEDKEVDQSLTHEEETCLFPTKKFDMIKITARTAAVSDSYNINEFITCTV